MNFVTKNQSFIILKFQLEFILINDYFSKSHQIYFYHKVFLIDWKLAIFIFINPEIIKNYYHYSYYTFINLVITQLVWKELKQ